MFQFQVSKVISIHLSKVVPKHRMVHTNSCIQDFVPLKVPMILLNDFFRIPTAFREDVFLLKIVPDWPRCEVHAPLLPRKDIVLHRLLSFDQVEVEYNQRQIILFNLAQVLT